MQTGTMMRSVIQSSNKPARAYSGVDSAKKSAKKSAEKSAAEILAPTPVHADCYASTLRRTRTWHNKLFQHRLPRRTLPGAGVLAVLTAFGGLLVTTTLPLAHAAVATPVPVAVNSVATDSVAVEAANFFAATPALARPASLIPLQDAPHLDVPMNLDDARHLLARTGFGASPGELQSLLGKTRRQGIEHIVAGLRQQPQTPVPAWVTEPVPRYWTRADMEPPQRRAFNRARDREMAQMRAWWVREMIETRSPQTERLVLFWHDHFATGYGSINEMSTSIARQNLMLRRLGSDGFGQILQAIVRDPAMLNYLDNNSNRKGSPNENLAREFLELFTLGEGNYTEADIKAAARALTGYSIAALRDQQFRFEDWKHDKGRKMLFGHEGAFNADDLIEIILQQPATARFITEKFWHAFIGQHLLNERELTGLAQVFRDSGYHITSLYQHLLASPSFWHADARASIIKSPVDLIVGTIRSTGVVPADWQTLPAQLAQLGQNLFEPPNVAGWPGNGAWVTPARLLNRYQWLAALTDPACENCAPSQAPAMGMMSSMMDEANGGMDAGMAMTTGSNIASPVASDAAARLRIRLAAENYEGAPRYQVRLLRQREPVWESPIATVVGGHDTERYGRMESVDNMPWQVSVFEMPDSVPAYDAVTVAFLNDHAAAEGDRNLYVDWIDVGGDLYLTSSGHQDSGCPPRRQADAGALYCSGAVTVARELAFDDNAKTAGGDTAGTALLQAGYVHLSWLNHPGNRKGREAGISFVLTDLVVGSSRWDNLYVNFRRDPDQTYSMHIDNFGCAPQCVVEWPPCAWQGDGMQAYRELAFPLQTPPPGSELDCHYQSLSADETVLVNGLWQSLPVLYEMAARTPKALRANMQPKVAAWRPLIREMQQQLSASRYQAGVSAASEILQITETFRLDLPPPTPPFMQQTPVAAGIAPDRQQTAMAQLADTDSTLDLADLLLATRGISAASASGETLATVLQAPEFQLK